MKNIAKKKKKDTFFKKYIKQLPFLSLIINFLVALFNIITGLFLNYSILIIGIYSLLISFSKLVSLYSISKNKANDTRFNLLTAILIFISSLIYIIYMSLLLNDLNIKTKYTLVYSIFLALIAFTQLTITIRSFFKINIDTLARRNLLLIYFICALTSLLTTQIALLSINTSPSIDTNFYNGISGISIGIFTLIISLFIVFSKKYSLIVNNNFAFKEVDSSKNKKLDLTNKENSLVLIKSKIYGTYIYSYSYQDDSINGNIIKVKPSIKNINIFIKIILIILSEILIFIYLIGYLIFLILLIFIKDKLIKIMEDNGFRLMNQINKSNN